MNAHRPPRIAFWLITHLSSSYHREALLGDLLEMHAGGRSRLWCWRQLGAVAYAAATRRLHLRWRGDWGAFLKGTIKGLLLAFGLIGLGVATLSWADATRTAACPAPTCRLQSP